MSPQDLMYLEQLVGRGGFWLPVTMLAGLLVALIFRPETIHNLFLFRASCWILVLSMIVPSLSNILLSGYNNLYSGIRINPSAEVQMVAACLNAIGPVMQGTSIICGLFSLIPPMIPRRPFAGPVKHPLE
jgi:hypothetical protein